MSSSNRLVILTLFSFPFSSALAENIGINFGSGRANAELFPADSAGVVPQTNWNNAPGAAGGPLVLNDASGAATPATVTWATDEEWSIGGPGADPNGTLLNGWVSANNTAAPPATITLTGIPFASYNLIVYFNHDRGTEDVLIREASSHFAPILAHENDTDILVPVFFTEQTATAEGDPTQQGNYLTLSGLQKADLEIILEPGGGAGSTDRGAVTGIQIIETFPGDSDGDGLDDTWENSFGLDPNDNGLNPNNNGVPGNPDNGANGDPDNDGSPNIEEQARNTFPNDNDSDNDTLLDGVETGTGIYVDANDTGTNPLSTDSDDDNLADNVETNTGTLVDEFNTGTDPNSNDTDEDSLRDDWEIANNLNPFDNGTLDPDFGGNGDPDNDGSSNANEQAQGTDPQDEDSDDDNLLDGVETGTGLFVDANDTGTNPLNRDSDNDGLPDGAENNSGTFVDASNTGTDPNNPNTDGDLFGDSWEALNGSDPNRTDAYLADAGAIGLNFGAGRANASLLDSDLAGIAPQAFWNNLATATGSDLTLTDDQGAESGATVTWSMEEEWSIGGPAFDANGTLLNGWFAAQMAGVPNTIDITNIPFATYDLVVYMNHDRASEDVLLSEANGAFPDFVIHENDTDILAEVVFNQQAVSAAEDGTQAGNFAIFPNLTSSSLNLTLNPAGDWGSIDRGAITGLQLVNRGAATGLRITSIVTDRQAGTVTVTWNSISGRNYAIDAGSSPQLTAADEIADFTATGEVSTFTEFAVDFDSTPKRFYRIRELTE